MTYDVEFYNYYDKSLYSFTFDAKCEKGHYTECKNYIKNYYNLPFQKFIITLFKSKINANTSSSN